MRTTEEQRAMEDAALKAAMGLKIDTRPPPAEDYRAYLGDGVYADFDGFQVSLTAHSNGQTNVIYLEPKVMVALMKYVDELKRRRST